MVEIVSKIEQNFLVEKDTRLHGMIVGSVNVKKGVTFIVHGMIVGDVVNFGKTIVYGTVTGQLTNHGEIEIDKNSKINKI